MILKEDMSAMSQRNSQNIARENLKKNPRKSTFSSKKKLASSQGRDLENLTLNA